MFQTLRSVFEKKICAMNQAITSRGKKFCAISQNCREALAMSAKDIDEYDLKISVENFKRRLNLLGTAGTEGTT